MQAERRRIPGRTRRLAASKFPPPVWYGWLAAAAMFLLPVVELPSRGDPWFFPLMSLGEWLLLPLGFLSLSMGLLTLWKARERTVLPLWITAVVPAGLFLAAAVLSQLVNGASSSGIDILLSWSVHLIFPVMAFLPLLARPAWRDRLMWALTGGIAANIAVIAWQTHTAGAAEGSAELLRLGGLLASQHDYGLMLAAALPLLAAWRGGNTERNRSLAVLICTFLLPALALTVCFGFGGLAAAAAGLAVSLAAWRGSAWIMGIFICLLVFGYGSGDRSDRDTSRRRLMAESALMGSGVYQSAFDTFVRSPYLGDGPEAFRAGDGRQPADSPAPVPWYAALLGGTGLAGLGMWLVLLAELAARALGKYGRRCIWYGGVLGGAAGLTAAGLWTDALPEGAGAMAGLLLAVSILEEPKAPPALRRMRRRKAVKKFEDSGSLPPEVSGADSP